MWQSERRAGGGCAKRKQADILPSLSNIISPRPENKLRTRKTRFFGLSTASGRLNTSTSPIRRTSTTEKTGAPVRLAKHQPEQQINGEKDYAFSKRRRREQNGSSTVSDKESGGKTSLRIQSRKESFFRTVVRIMERPVSWTRTPRDRSYCRFLPGGRRTLG